MKKKKRSLSYNLRKRKPQPLYKKQGFWLFIFIGAVVLGLGYVLFFNYTFKIKTITFNVEENIKADIEGFVLPEQGRAFILVNSGKIEKRILQKISYLKAINVKRVLPNELLVEKAIEREPVFEFCFATSSDGCYENNKYLIDKEAMLFRKETTEKMLALLSNQEMVGAGELEKIIFIKDFFNNDLQKPIKKLVLENSFLSVYTSGGFKVFFDLENDLAEKLSALRYLLVNTISQEKQKTLDYIDLRFSKIYYK